MRTSFSSSIKIKIWHYLVLARLHRPIGIWLMMFPALWALFLSSPHPIPFKEALFLILGSLFIRSAGCVYNDLVDRDFDGKVIRTAGRPLAAGKLTLGEGVGWFFLLLTLSFLVLITFPKLTILMGITGVPLILLYPWMKRITYWPQLFLGFTMNWGLLIGWTAAGHPLRPPLLFMMLGGIFWTLGYDTIYAHQDKEDDRLIGLKSTALWLSHKTKTFLALTYIGFLCCFMVLGLFEKLSWPYYLSLAFIALNFHKQVFQTNFDDPSSCLQAFKSNAWVGLGLLIGILASQYLPPLLK